KLGSLTRFVSHSVMTGFLIGISLLIVFGQIGDFVGYDPPRSNKVAQTIYVAVHPSQIEPRALAVGVLTIVLAVLLPRTRLREFGTLVALIVPSLVATLPAFESVEIVSDVGDIPSGLPLPDFPSFSVLSLDLFTGALAIAVISLIQGAGVAQNFPNPAGHRASISGDFTAQGIANVAAGVFQGQPVGGSVGDTALNVSAKARSRWAAIFSGLWMAVILLLFAGLVGRVAMPALAALLILAGFSALNVREGLTVWRTGWAPRIAGVTTLVATLFLPIQWAVAIGAALSATIHLFTASVDVSLVQLVQIADGRLAEHQPPAHLPSREIIVLDVHGSLFYAGAWTLGRALPEVEGAEAPAVVLRLRNRMSVGATFIDILGRYADQIRAAGGRLYLVGLDPHVAEQIRRTGKLGSDTTVAVYLETPVLLESTERAIADAQAWLTHLPPGKVTAGDAAAAPSDGRVDDSNGATVLADETENTERER
ncbi:MAG: SulP family inorganic anion transporter, partial [Dehalococcoidia bacterium]